MSNFPAVLAAVAARGPRCLRCRAWTMDPDQVSYSHPMCDRCATTLEELRIRFRSAAGFTGPANVRRTPRPARRHGAACALCTVWRCKHCGWKRNPAWRDELQVCADCGRTDGERVPVRHRSGRWYVHNVLKRKV